MLEVFVGDDSYPHFCWVMWIIWTFPKPWNLCVLCGFRSHLCRCFSPRLIFPFRICHVPAVPAARLAMELRLLGLSALSTGPGLRLGVT